MAVVEVKVPDIGDFTGVPVIEWLVSVGDEVEAEQGLITLESDKATMDVPAPQAGVIEELLVDVGDTVSEGDSIARMSGGDDHGADGEEGSGEAEGSEGDDAGGDGEASGGGGGSGESGLRWREDEKAVIVMENPHLARARVGQPGRPRVPPPPTLPSMPVPRCGAWTPPTAST